MPYLYRRALAQDAADCVTLRGQTRENALSVEQLRAIGVTVDSWRAGIEDESLLGHVCLHAGKLAGYCFGDAASGEILVLVVMPDHEGQGIGKRLLNCRGRRLPPPRPFPALPRLLLKPRLTLPWLLPPSGLGLHRAGGCLGRRGA